MLLNAQNGFEVGTEIQARYARAHEKPIIAVINQLDSEKASWENTLESLRVASGVKPVLVQYPVNPGPGFDAFVDVLLMKMYKFKGDTGIREELEIPESEMERARELNQILTEAAAENDESLMGTLFRQRRADAGRNAFGAETQGCQTRLGAGVLRFGQTRYRGETADGVYYQRGSRPDQGSRFPERGRRRSPADSKAPTALFVFKSAVEPHLGEMTFFRVVSGRVAEGMELINSKTGNKEKISQLFAVAGKGRVKVTEMEAGDIGCTVKLKGTRTNQTRRHRIGNRDRTDQIPGTPLPGGRPVGQDGRGRKARRAAESGSFRGSDDPGRVFERTETDDRARGRANTT